MLVNPTFYHRMLGHHPLCTFEELQSNMGSDAWAEMSQTMSQSGGMDLGNLTNDQWLELPPLEKLHLNATVVPQVSPTTPLGEVADFRDFAYYSSRFPTVQWIR